MLLAKLGTMLLGNLITAKAKIPWRVVIRASDEVIRSRNDF